MRIISTFKDYYDSIQAYGLDGDRVYVREQAIIKVDPNTLDRSCPPIADIEWSESTVAESRSGQRYRRVDASYVMIGYCGRFYPLAALHFAEEREYPCYDSRSYSHSEYFTTPADFSTGILDLPGDFRLVHRSGSDEKHPIQARLANAFHQVQSACAHFENHSLFRTLDTALLCRGFTSHPVEILPDCLRYHKVCRNHDMSLPILSNPRLKDFDFAKVKDPYTCFQDISQYLSGVLGSIEKDGTDLSDKQQVQRHGFDEKYGFRTRPQE